MTNTAFSYTFLTLFLFSADNGGVQEKGPLAPQDLLLLCGDNAVENEEAGGGGGAVVDEAGELPGLLC
jgi:hypothetical protein